MSRFEPDLLTRRNGTWHFVRRVPAAFTHLDSRGIIKHSTKIRIASDRNGRRAAAVAARLNDQLEAAPALPHALHPDIPSWLNLIERFFAEKTRKRIRRGVFRSVLDLEVAIYRYLAEHNEHPKPFVWTAKPVAILDKIKRGKQALESEQ